VKDAVAIRDVRAEKGRRSQGFVDIANTPAGKLRIPLVIVNGAEDGPILCLTAGVHATEYLALRGTVIAVPVVNTAMFESRTPFVSPIDGLNLNNIAPGNPDGSISEVLAHILLTEIIGVSQYYIDIHGGDLGP
jgi:predicted deacylase